MVITIPYNPTIAVLEAVDNYYADEFYEYMLSRGSRGVLENAARAHMPYEYYMGAPEGMSCKEIANESSRKIKKSIISEIEIISHSPLSFYAFSAKSILAIYYAKQENEDFGGNYEKKLDELGKDVEKFVGCKNQITEYIRCEPKCRIPVSGELEKITHEDVKKAIDFICPSGKDEYIKNVFEDRYPIIELVIERCPDAFGEGYLNLFRNKIRDAKESLARKHAVDLYCSSSEELFSEAFSKDELYDLARKLSPNLALKHLPREEYEKYKGTFFEVLDVHMNSVFAREADRKWLKFCKDPFSPDLMDAEKEI